MSSGLRREGEAQYGMQIELADHSNGHATRRLRSSCPMGRSPPIQYTVSRWGPRGSNTSSISTDAADSRTRSAIHFGGLPSGPVCSSTVGTLSVTTDFGSTAPSLYVPEPRNAEPSICSNRWHDYTILSASKPPCGPIASALVFASKKSSPISLISSSWISLRPARLASMDAGVRSCSAYL